MTEDITPAIARLRAWLNAPTRLTPQQHGALTDVAAYIADVDQLNGAASAIIPTRPAPDGDDVMSAMLCQIADAPAPRDLKGPLGIVSEWLAGETQEPAADVLTAVAILVDETERIEAHCEKLADGIQITSVGTSLATMTDGGRAEAGDATTRLATGLQPLSGQCLDVSLTAKDNLSPALRAAADELSRVMRERTDQQPE